MYLSPPPRWDQCTLHSTPQQYAVTSALSLVNWRRALNSSSSSPKSSSSSSHFPKTNTTPSQQSYFLPHPWNNSPCGR
ncbi:hypothetical protein E2C01_049701 [Portunus trituberculatus]|uniref:Uncharacterized protein n=1 Tax=Portunus trituberculatus TaxID=210409 RepID=A0A5B7GEI6_PORTR|nr:hypothetical protein [Portunus trituberculatus]